MNNQDVSVERFFQVSSIEYRVLSTNSIHDTRCLQVSSVSLHLVGTVSKLNVLNSAAAHNEIYLISIFAYCKQELSKGYFDSKRIS